MLWSDVMRLFEHWSRSPPLRTLAAAWMGFKPTDDEAAPQEYMTAEAFKMIVDSTRQGRTLLQRR